MRENVEVVSKNLHADCARVCSDGKVPVDLIEAVIIPHWSGKEHDDECHLY